MSKYPGDKLWFSSILIQICCTGLAQQIQKFGFVEKNAGYAFIFGSMIMLERGVPGVGKIFNTSGGCKPELHYMVDISKQLEELKKMVDCDV